MSTERINNLIEDYIEEVKDAIRSSKPLAGVFGLRGGIGDSPCHMKFYDSLKELIESGDFDAYETVRLLLHADSSYEAPDAAKFMLTAVQGLAIPLVPKLSAEQRGEFKQFLDDNVPRRKRLPVQDQLYKALKK